MSHPTFAGFPVAISDLCPEFIPVIQMNECGCSRHVLDDFNKWLLDRFGQKRLIYKAAGQLIMNPRTMHAIQQSIGREGGAL